MSQVRRRISCIAALFMTLLWGCGTPPLPPHGVVIDRVEPPLDRVLEPGDVVLGWQAGHDAPLEQRSGELRTPLDLGWLAGTAALFDGLQLILERHGQRISVTAPRGRWRYSARPVLGAEQALLYQAGLTHAEAGEIEEAVDSWGSLLERLDRQGRHRAAVWLSARIAEETLACGRPELGEPHLAGAGDPVERSPSSHGDSVSAVGFWEAVGEAREKVADYPGAAEAYELARQAASGAPDGRLLVAAQTCNLGVIAFDTGDLDRAEELHTQALAIWRDAAPASRGPAIALNNLAAVAQARGRIDQAEELFSRALALTEALAPGTMEVAIARNNLGAMAYFRGDLTTAQEWFRRSLELRQTLAPGSLRVAAGLNNLGAVAWERGDLISAENAHRQALKIRRQLAPGSLAEARSLDNLGHVADRRGAARLARTYFGQALAIRRNLAPDGLEVANSLSNLASVALEHGDPKEASKLEAQALEIRESRAPSSLDVAASLFNMAGIASAQGDDDRAEALHRRALDLRRTLAPSSLHVALSQHRLAELCYRRGDNEQAARWCNGALEIRRRLAPGSSLEAESLHLLSRIERHRSRPERAIALLEEAMDALARQEPRLGGDINERTNNQDQQEIYRDAMQLYLDRGALLEALDALERGRARQMLIRLGHRRLEPAAVPELQRRRMARLEYELRQLREALAELDGDSNSTEVERLIQEVEQLHAERSALGSQLRTQQPALEQVIGAPVRSAAEAADQLSPGTLVLSYSIGRQHSFLFTLARGSAGSPQIAVHPLDITEQALPERVLAARLLLQSPEAGKVSRRALDRRLAALYLLLMEPARAEIAASSRLLIIPDGPLHTLPFAALPLSQHSARLAELPPGSRLVEWKPSTTSVSLGLHAALASARPLRESGDHPHSFIAPGSVIAFADPAPAGSGAARSEGAEPGSLPGAREEAHAIARIYPQAACRVYLGVDATEEAARSVFADAGVLHLACHAAVDERFPLDSYVALAADDQHDGLLRAWEIIETLHTEADLVTLSGCETAAGVEATGEGLIGLTRAFHIAGARSVLASLWRVDDRATAALMAAFYRHLRAGAGKDEALQAAQLELIHGTGPARAPACDQVAEEEPAEMPPSFLARLMGCLADEEPLPLPRLDHPAYWAAFQLSGDRRQASQRSGIRPAGNGAISVQGPSWLRAP